MHHIWKDEFKTFEKTLGWPFIKILGCGGSGCVYASTDNKVVKATIEYEEYAFSKKLIGKFYKYLPRIFAVTELDVKQQRGQMRKGNRFVPKFAVGPLYFILKENIEDLPKNSTLSKIGRHDEIPILKVGREVFDISKMVTWGKRYFDVSFVDYHVSNWGIRASTGEIVFRDYGNFLYNT